jgi:sulfite reductase (NADPH) flavoprotein alpha-component
MTPPSQIPVVPESAPFTPEQRAYLNGFFAGLFSRAPIPANGQPAPEPLQPLTILFGSQTGNAEGLARRIAKQAGKQGFAPTVFEMGQYPRSNLASEQSLLIVTSTYGDGEPPDNARLFWDFVSSKQAPALPNVNFSVLALGDSNYPKFCECGKNFDQQLEVLGACRVHPRVDCDVEVEDPFRRWLEAVLPALAAKNIPTADKVSENRPLPFRRGEGRGENPPNAMNSSLEPLNRQLLQRRPSSHPLPGERAGVGGDGAFELLLARLPTTVHGEGPVGQDNLQPAATPSFSRSHPFPGRLLTNRKLNGPGSEKDTRHLEVSLDGSGLSYEVGDALGVMPTNCPDLVADILRALNSSGDDTVPDANGAEATFRDALLRHYELTRIPQPLLQAAAEKSGDETLKQLCSPGANGALTEFLRGRDIIDLFIEFPRARFAPSELVGLLKKLQPRLYSIASSPRANAHQAHLTVGIVRYHSRGRARKGVCSCFLAERAQNPGSLGVRVFIQANNRFRPPRDAARPIIMVGPGTGIAPFRAFLQERRATGATGRNWLFFGDQHAATDFLYREELQAMMKDGLLTRLDTAFSRDQERKIYVQHRLQENAREIFDWLEQGAHFYVCGDAKRMAADVEAALHQVIQRGGQRTAEQAEQYVHHLKTEQRYQRDVY